MNKYNMMVDSLNKITYQHIKTAVEQSLTASVESRGPLGYRTSSIVIYGDEGDERRNGVSINQHSCTIKMLITDGNGYFLFYGGYSMRCAPKFIAKELFRIFKNTIANKP